MPSDANGVHSLPNGYHAEDGDTIQPSQHNPPLEDLSSGLTERLMRSGVAPMTGQLKLADGNSGAPGLAFNSDPSAGFYLANGKIIFTKPIVQKEMIGLGPLPWSRMTAPPGWVLCYGQTLNRVTYADLWAVAQAEIAAGNPMYNNGDGSMTFGILDARGRVSAGYDVMGGAPGGRLTGTFGSGVGIESQSLTQAQLPAISPTFTGINDPVSLTSTQGFWGGNSAFSGGPSGPITLPAGPGTVTSTGFFTPRGNISALGSGAVLSKVQSTLITNAILYAGA
jgi:microcystin-dependent protein